MMIYVVLALVCLALATLIFWAVKGRSEHRTHAYSGNSRKTRHRKGSGKASASGSWGWSRTRGSRHVPRHSAGKGAHHSTLIPTAASLRTSPGVPFGQGLKNDEKTVLTGYDLTRTPTDPTSAKQRAEKKANWAYRDGETPEADEPKSLGDREASLARRHGRRVGLKTWG